MPLLYALSDAASFNTTVRPFLKPDLLNLEDVVFSAGSLWRFYLECNPAVFAFLLCIFNAVLVYTVSEVSRNYSQVDRLWSILPTTYQLHFVIRGYFTGTGKHGLLAPRIWIMFLLEFIWTVRLTRNYARKGGYKWDAEDYRWATVRANLPLARLTWPLLNLFFIAIAQNILLMMLAMPGYIVLLVGSERALCWADVLLLECIIFLLGIQLYSDDTQLRYQEGKNHHRDGTATIDNTYREFSPAELERGFVTKGFWAYSRHPAFLCEQLIWLCVYLYSVVATGVWFNWTGWGALSLAILFQASTILTERISAGKYPQYKDYQARVGMLIPFPGYQWDEAKYTKKQK
ncbi:hypothetical protein BCR37DRAFT_347844 [Protomyces lactucae-debilis]|uniref:Steroid 5-alpha reductase C-terminal domain-containing protein n=1 Tax=Protomyces lactucae-debilis TaxID=2754530 RepID=A0A1Y2FDP9_PROLT|nr:uncharacterized protein BCR37DRAFT_347844 [Protomyces lactucae-debilis]ORY82042.1 hypothetical protein BCR37DRAFT_347844 [Protomyces lactucae-debilis]